MQFYGTAGGGVYRETLSTSAGDQLRHQRRRRREDDAGGAAPVAARLSRVLAAGQPAAHQAAAVLRGDQSEVLSEGAAMRRTRCRDGIVPRSSDPGLCVSLTGVRFSLLPRRERAAHFLHISCVSGARCSSGVIIFCSIVEDWYSAPWRRRIQRARHRARSSLAQRLGRLVDFEAGRPASSASRPSSSPCRP